MMRKVAKDTEAIGLDVSDMTAPNPLVSRLDTEPQLYRVSASADWHNDLISFQIFSVNDQGKKTLVHANFVVRLTPKQAWLDEFKRNGYLIQSRIASLHASADGGTGGANKLKRRIVYQLFSAIVNYGDSFQGMQEVTLDSENHEATARISFQVDENGFTFNPCWIDSLGHIAGFIMNSSDASPFKTGVFINAGWEHMRCAVNFVKGKEYEVHSRMQLRTGNTYIGDTYILEDQKVVAVYEGVRVSSSQDRAQHPLIVYSSKAFLDMSSTGCRIKGPVLKFHSKSLFKRNKRPAQFSNRYRRIQQQDHTLVPG